MQTRSRSQFTWCVGMLLWLVLAAISLQAQTGGVAPLQNPKPGDAALLQALQQQDNAALKKLLATKADPNTEFHFFTKDTHIGDLARTLRDRDGKLVRMVSPEELFSTPLTIASQIENIEAVKLLLAAGADPNKTDVMGGTPLMATQDIKSMRLLVEHGADVNAQASPMGLTPLILSLNRGTAALQLLLDHGADINKPTFNSLTPLICAMTRSAHPVLTARFLIQHGANLRAKTRDGATVLMFACQCWDYTRSKGCRAASLDIWQACLDAGENVNARDDYGGTALLWTLQTTGVGNAALARFLLRHGANPNLQNQGGETPLLCAARNTELQVVQMLLQRGAKADTQDAGGATPLLWAVGRDAPAIAALLIKAGAKVNMRDAIGTTPLNWACSIGNPKMVRLLLAHGAKINVSTRDGRTAIQIARTMHHPNIVRLLRQAGAKPHP